jgi:hypothetical protein
LLVVVVGALALGPAPIALAADGDSTGAPAAVDTPDPVDSQPSPDDSTEPTPPDDDPSTLEPPPPPPPPPPADSPTPTQPVESATPAAPSHGPVPVPVLRVTVYASNAVLGSGYWNGQNTTSFAITVRNTGTVAAAVKVNYTVPHGVTDTATGACRHGSCSVTSIAPDTSVALPVAVTVSPDAWRNAPLTGQLSFSASAAGAQVSSDQGTWGVIFPPGPPAPGIGLQVGNVTLDARPEVPGQLKIKVTNTGALPAATTVDVVVPDGVSQGPMPANCQDQRQLDASAARCVLGTLAPGEQSSIVVPLTVDARARDDAPLAGLVRATLTPAGQEGRTTQASYEILVPTDQGGVSVGSTASAPSPTGADHVNAFVLSSRSPAALPIIAGSTVLLIMVIAALVLALRKRPAGPVPAGGTAPRHAGAAGGTAPRHAAAGAVPAGAAAAIRPGGPDLDPAWAEPDPAPDSSRDPAWAELNSGPEPDPGPAAGPDAQPDPQPEPAPEPQPDSRPDPEPEPRLDLGPVPGSSGPVRLEWTELPGSTPPSGQPVDGNDSQRGGYPQKTDDSQKTNDPRETNDPRDMDDPPEMDDDPRETTAGRGEALRWGTG